MSKQQPESKRLLVTLSASAVLFGNPKFSKTAKCIQVHTNHHAAKVVLNFLSVKEDNTITLGLNQVLDKLCL